MSIFGTTSKMRRLQRGIVELGLGGHATDMTAPEMAAHMRLRFSGEMKRGP